MPNAKPYKIYKDEFDAMLRKRDPVSLLFSKVESHFYGADPPEPKLVPVGTYFFVVAHSERKRSIHRDVRDRYYWNLTCVIICGEHAGRILWKSVVDRFRSDAAAWDWEELVDSPAEIKPGLKFVAEVEHVVYEYPCEHREYIGKMRQP